MQDSLSQARANPANSKNDRDFSLENILIWGVQFCRIRSLRFANHSKIAGFARVACNQSQIVVQFCRIRSDEQAHLRFTSKIGQLFSIDFGPSSLKSRSGQNKFALKSGFSGFSRVLLMVFLPPNRSTELALAHSGRKRPSLSQLLLREDYFFRGTRSGGGLVGSFAAYHHLHSVYSGGWLGQQLRCLPATLVGFRR